MVFPSITRNHDFSEGLIWLKCSHWLEGMSILIKGMGHERHMVLLVGWFLYQVSCCTSNKKGQRSSRSLWFIQIGQLEWLRLNQIGHINLTFNQIGHIDLAT